jgi:hypothetical protein
VKCGSSLAEIAVHGASVDFVTKVSKTICNTDQLGPYLEELDQMIDDLTKVSAHDQEEQKWLVPSREPSILERHRI